MAAAKLVIPQLALAKRESFAQQSGNFTAVNEGTADTPLAASDCVCDLVKLWFAERNIDSDVSDADSELGVVPDLFQHVLQYFWYL